MYSACLKLFISFILFYCTILNYALAADDHGNTCKKATIINVGSSAVGELTEKDLDFFSITIPSKGRLTLFSTGGTDTFAQLLDKNGVLLAENNNSGVKSNFLISKELEAESYCLQVSGAEGLYSLTVEGDFANDDHGSSCETGTVILDPRGTTIVGELSTYADADYFRIITPTSGQITVSTTGETNTTGKLFDANNIALETNKDSGIGSNFLINKDLEVGSYCLEVSGESGLYSLRVEGDFFDDDHGSDCSSATPINSRSTRGELLVNKDKDYFRIQVPEKGTTVTLQTSGDTNTKGRLFDFNGVFLEEDDNTGDGTNFLINRRLLGGSYCLEISGDKGIYSLKVEGQIAPIDSFEPYCSGQTIYDSTTGRLKIPDVRLDGSCYTVEMQKREEGFIFDLISADPAQR